MASEQASDSSEGMSEADFAKAFQELAKGERAATALENQLSDMEKKIEELVARAEREQEDIRKTKEASSSTNGQAPSS